MQDVPKVENLETKKDKAKRLFVTPPLFVIFGIRIQFLYYTHTFPPKIDIIAHY